MKLDGPHAQLIHLIMTITEAIPHRPPFLLVDEVVAVEETAIHTRRRVDPDWPQALDATPDSYADQMLQGPLG